VALEEADAGQEIGEKGKMAVIMIVFRGAWLDGMMVMKGVDSLEQLEGRIAGSNYFEELKGFALGRDFLSVLGQEGERAFEAWTADLGKGMLMLGNRNRELAEVMVRGIGEGLRGKS
jgi:hypothetical protein